jgi:TonB family protein
MKKNIFLILVILFCLQPAFAQSPKTDREEQGLKGKVRNINAQMTKLSNHDGQAVGQSQLTYIERYDEEGNLTYRESFDYKGNPRSETNYQIIDGEKTAKNKYFSYDYDPPSPMAPPASGTSKPGDPRYDMKYKMKYEKNKIERTLIYNNGNQGNRIVMTFDDKGNQIKHELYIRDGSLNYSRTSTYDEKGNEIESKSYGADGSLMGRYKYTDYEVDWRGNWIKRKTWSSKSETAEVEPYELNLRTISYFDDKASSVANTQTGNLPKFVRLSTGVLAEKATKKVNPAYPAEALAAGISGEVLIEVTVDEQGNVAAAEGVSGDRILAEAAIAAVRQWKFKPTALGGVPVKVIGRIRFNFNR